MIIWGPMINEYKFGEMVVNHRRFTSDIAIMPNGRVTVWRRINGHEVVPDDITHLLRSGPDILIIGTGENGLMKVSDEVKALARTRGIELIIETTGMTVDIYNDVHESAQVLGAFHLTC